MGEVKVTVEFECEKQVSQGRKCIYVKKIYINGMRYLKWFKEEDLEHRKYGFFLIGSDEVVVKFKQPLLLKNSHHQIKQVIIATSPSYIHWEEGGHGVVRDMFYADSFGEILKAIRIAKKGLDDSIRRKERELVEWKGDVSFSV